MCLVIRFLLFPLLTRREREIEHYFTIRNFARHSYCVRRARKTCLPRCNCNFMQMEKGDTRAWHQERYYKYCRRNILFPSRFIWIEIVDLFVLETREKILHVFLDSILYFYVIKCVLSHGFAWRLRGDACPMSRSSRRYALLF